LGAALPEGVGGGGAGFFAACIVAENLAQVGGDLRYVALMSAALPIARFGSVAQQRQLLPGVIAGTTTVTAALEGWVETGQSKLYAEEYDGTVRLSGIARCVPYADLSQAAVVIARRGNVNELFLVNSGASGLTSVSVENTLDEPQADWTLNSVEAEPLGRGGAVPWAVERAVTLLSFAGVGLATAMLQMTADYTKHRQQFGVSIASFQAVRQRAADAYIDRWGAQLTAMEAGWRLDQELPAADVVASAKAFGSGALYNVTRAASHLHGGIGFDISYPLGRYFFLSKVVQLRLGSISAHLDRLGGLIAADGLDPADRLDQ
ncbi:MAG: acyl-CoA dehydrogenase family protein, partial [Acidimicrobiales bacterium]